MDKITSAPRGFWWLALGLATVLAITRLGHFGEHGGPPDASWAVFFLAGLWLRDLRLFPAYFVLGWIVDLTAFALGTPTNCYGIAYLFLIPAYGALFLAGRWGSDRGYGRVSLAVTGSSVVTFFLANLGMFWLAPSPAALSLSEFASTVAGYYPGYLMTMATYVAGGIVIERVLRFRRRALT
ncbi:MAG: hypothetical protein FJ196_06150 [Gammaproteobacteria bacterium]|nr:hypothetical protein [Gammaproteobacteria bacterium]